MTTSSKLVSALFIFLFALQTQAASILGPKNYTAAPNTKNYTESLSLNAQDALLIYKLKVKNADGADHLQATCNQSNIIARLVCRLTNTVQTTYINLFRVQSAQITINGIVVMNATQMNQNVKYFEAPVLLKTANSILIQVKGQITSQINVEIEKPVGPPVDNLPPVLTFDLPSNSVTKNLVLNVTVTDSSSVITYVWDNQQNLLLTTQLKQFSIPLKEGLNNFVLQSTDAAQNSTSFLYVNNLVRDTTPAIITTNLVSELIYSSYPQTFILNLTANENLQSLSINGVLANMVAPRMYNFLLNVSAPGTLNLTISSLDIAGNVSSQVFTPIFSIDNIPPTISASLASNAITNQNLLHVFIVDNANVSTQVYLNDILIATETAKEFNVTLREGSNSVRLIAKDQYENQSLPLVLSNIILDSKAPAIASNIQSNYFVQALPANIILNFTTNEEVQSLSVDGSFATKVDSQHFQYSLSVNAIGIRSILVKANDLAGNETSMTFSFSVAIDNVAPVIGLTAPSAEINSASYLVPISVVDVSATETEILLNQVSLARGITEKNFSYLIDFPNDGTYTLTVISTDAAGNSSTKSVALVRNSALLNLSVQAPQSGAIYNSQVVEVRFSANKILSKAYVNNLEVPLSSDLKSVKFFTQVASLGLFDTVIRVETMSGETQSVTVNAEIKLNGASSWNYEECSIAEGAQ